jgi:DNA-binding CsgD family transcriptional regulator/ligand-binding sensor domain-containing protein
MKRYSSILQIFILLVIGQSSCLWAQTTVPKINNFSKKEYRAANQNWSVNAAPNGYIYFANHHGLLEFDGTSWTLHKLPNETILRSVLVASDSLIFTGGYREMGYWKRSEWGSLSYYSLNNIAERYFSKNEEFWNIAMMEDSVYFHSFGTILIYKDNFIKRIELPGFATTMRRCQNKILAAIRDSGIYSIEQGEAKPFITDPRLNNITLRFIIPYKKEGLLLGTASNGIFEWDGNEIKEWNPAWTDYFIKNNLNRAHVSEQGHIILGTIIDGITVFDQNNELIASFNTSNGLQNNTVLGIDTDRFNNIWLALDSGIDFVSDNSSQGIKIDNIPGIGSIYDAAIFENNIYLGTNRGLFFKPLEVENNNYRLVGEVQGQVWHCSIIDQTLIVGYNEGILGIKNGKAYQISDRPGGFSIRPDPFHPEEIFVESSYSNLVTIEKENGVFRQRGNIKGFFDLIRFIEFDHAGNLWASHMRRGIYKLQLNTERDSVMEANYYGGNSVFGKDHSLHVFKIENRVVFTTEKLIYTYDDLKDSIIPYTHLNRQLEEFAAAQRIIRGPKNHYWLITEEKMGLFFILNNEVKHLKTIPMTLFTSNELIDEFENIYPTGPMQSIICLENGIAFIDAKKANKNPEITQFVPNLRKITLTDNQGKKGKIYFEENTLQVKYRHNNMQVRYSFPHYTHENISFQAQMKGLNPGWSEKTEMPVFSFDRLPEGEYELLVKAIDPWENESQVHSLRIEVLPPWYLSNYAQTGYVFLFVLIMLGLQVWGIRRTRKKERRELEKREKELFKLRNEKLQNEVEHKSKELANSTMAIVKKNEFLLQLKKTVTNQKEQLETRYPDKYYYHLIKKIDDNISSHEDWHLFETNFERAHEQFLQKIKEQYPELTSKDLRLCAFLRMNLSSKEIAPLMGISVRGVENHRYRLRKKMGLDHDDSLIDMILKL